MSLFSRLQREKTNPRVKSTVTFNAPGTYFPPYGKTVFTVGGQGASGNSNPPTGGNTNPITQQRAQQTSFFGRPGTPSFTNPPSFAPVSWPASGPAPDGYCDDFVESPDSNFYFGFQICYGFFQNGGNTNPINPGNSNTGANANIFGVPFPGGDGGLAPTVGDTAISLPFSNSGYSVTVPAGGYVVFKNK